MKGGTLLVFGGLLGLVALACGNTKSAGGHAGTSSAGAGNGGQAGSSGAAGDAGAKDVWTAESLRTYWDPALGMDSLEFGTIGPAHVGDYLYFSSDAEPDGMGVYRMPKAGGDAVKVGVWDGWSVPVTADATHVYWGFIRGDERSIHKVPLAGGLPEEVVMPLPSEWPVSTFSVQVAESGSRLYIANIDCTAIGAVDKATGTLLWHAVPPGPADGGNCVGIAATNEYVFCDAGGHIFRYTADGSELTTLGPDVTLTDGRSATFQMLNGASIDDKELFVVDSHSLAGPLQVYAVDIQTLKVRRVVEEARTSASCSIAVDRSRGWLYIRGGAAPVGGGTFLFWKDYLSLFGHAFDVKGAIHSSCDSVASDSDWLYCSGSYDVFRIRKP